MATIREIEIFLRLADELHFGKTASSLGITQAALSREIGKLENSLACRLFDRSDKWNIRLTAAGKAYYAAVKNLPETLNNANNAALQASRGESGTLSIAVANLVYDHLPLGEILRKMHEKYPAVKLLIRDCQGSPHVYSQLNSHEADIGFLAVNNLGNPDSLYQHRKLLELPMSFLIPAQHPLAYKKDLKIEDFKNINFILPPEKYVPWLRKQFEQFFMEKCGTPPIVEQEALGMHATYQLVAAGLGVGLLAKPGSSTVHKNIVFREVDFPLRRIIVAAWNAGNHSHTLKNFLRILKKEPQNG